MTIQQLEYIVALDTYRHYVTAANNCFVTQPTITLQVKKLEEEIGIQIFDRSKTPLKPTKMGEVFILKARKILEEISHLKSIVSEERNSLTGTFKIGVIPTISPYIIPKFAKNFTKEHPNTYLNIEELKSVSIINALEKGLLDVGILTTPLNEPNLREIPLYNEPFVYYGAKQNKQNKISTKEVEKLDDLWLLNSGHCFANQVLNICNSPTKKNINFKSGSFETLMNMVDNNGGFTLIPALAANNIDNSKLLHFSEPKPIREVSMVVHKGFIKEEFLAVLRKHIINIIPNSFEKNEHFIKIKWR